MEAKLTNNVQCYLHMPGYVSSDMTKGYDIPSIFVDKPAATVDSGLNEMAAFGLRSFGAPGHDFQAKCSAWYVGVSQWLQERMSRNWFPRRRLMIEN